MKRPKARQVSRRGKCKGRCIEIHKGGGRMKEMCPHRGGSGDAAHSTCSVGQYYPCGHTDRGMCLEIARSLSTSRGNTEANIPSETRLCFLSGAAIAYVEMVAHEPVAS